MKFKILAMIYRMKLKRKIKVKKNKNKDASAIASAKASAGASARFGNITINIPKQKAPTRRRARTSFARVGVQTITEMVPSVNRLYDTTHVQANNKLLRGVVEQLAVQSKVLQEVQNTLLDDALRKNVGLLVQSNLNKSTFKPSSNSVAGFASPSESLTPNSTILFGAEKARQFLKQNIEHMPKLRSKKKGKERNYTEKEIDDLQVNRLQQLYNSTKENIERLNAPDPLVEDPEEGYITPEWANVLTDEMKNKLSTGKKLGRGEYRWLAEKGLLDLVPEDIFSLSKEV